MKAIETIQQDIACPNCDYNLRGLHGDVVTCPECGQICDIAQIVIRRWDKPWHRAPGLTRLYLPVVWALVAGWTVPTALSGALGADLTTRLILAIGFTIIYIFLFAQAWKVFRDIEAIWLSLFSHAILACYLGSIPFAIWIARMLGPNEALQLTIGVSLSVIGVAVGYIGERYVASRCIRHYLRRMPTS